MVDSIEAEYLWFRVTYDLPDVIRVESDGPVRIVRLSRFPSSSTRSTPNCISGSRKVFPQLEQDLTARVAVITGEGRAFSPVATSSCSTTW